MKRVLIIYTGGTIGMTRTENGYAPRAGYFRAALDAIPDLRAPEMPEWEFYELSPLLDSSNMTVREWNCIAELIAQKYDDYDGFVVLHGTDTMAYTASALSFMLDGLDKPVVLTGSQIPLCEIRSDGHDNLITALLIAGEGIVREVCLYFGGKLLRGNRATKYSADGLIAFVSPNYPSLAEAGISIKYNEAALLPRCFTDEEIRQVHLQHLSDLLQRDQRRRSKPPLHHGKEADGKAGLLRQLLQGHFSGKPRLFDLLAHFLLHGHPLRFIDNHLDFRRNLFYTDFNIA